MSSSLGFERGRGVKPASLGLNWSLLVNPMGKQGTPNILIQRVA